MATTTTKPGYATTEFWLTLAAMLIGTLVTSGAFADTSTIGKIIAFAATALASIGYSMSRAITKTATVTP